MPSAKHLIPSPPDSRRCSAISKRSGRRCPNWGMLDSDPPLCSAHNPTSRNVVSNDPEHAAKLKAAKKRRAKEDAADRAYRRTLSYNQLLRYSLEQKAEKVAEALNEMIESDDDNIRLRAIDLWQRRVYGNPVSPTVSATVQGLPPAQMAELKASLQGLSSEERLSLARERLGLKPAHPTDEAEVIDDVSLADS